MPFFDQLLFTVLTLKCCSDKLIDEASFNLFKPRVRLRVAALIVAQKFIRRIAIMADFKKLLLY